MITSFEGRARGSDSVYDTNAFMAEDSPGRTGGNVTFQDMQVGAADCGLGDFHNSVIRRLQDGLGTFFQGFETGTAINQGFHGAIRQRLAAIMIKRAAAALTPIKLSGGSQGL